MRDSNLWGSSISQPFFIYPVQAGDLAGQEPVETPAPPSPDHLWQVAIDAAELGLWDYRPQTGEKSYSLQWRRLRGLELDDPLPKDDAAWLELVHPDDREMSQKFTEQINRGLAAEVCYEYREKHRLGHWIWIMCRGRPVEFDENGLATRVVGIDTDISAIKAAEITRTEIARRLDIAVGVAEIGIWEFDLTTNKATWDARVKQIYGRPDLPDPIPDGTWEDNLHPDDWLRMTQFHPEMSEKGQPQDFRYRIIRPDGSIRFIRSRVARLDDAIKGPKLIGVNWDVTEAAQKTLQLEKMNLIARQRLAELEAAKSKLEYLSNHDPLTGLLNRRGLDTAIERVGAAMSGDGPTHAILQIDLDNFKELNDTLGHAAGDLILQRTAAVISAAVGKAGIAARVGGDEFTVILSEIRSADDACDVARHILRGLEQPLMHKDRPMHSFASLGIALCTGKDACEVIIGNADLAMYQAKRLGGNRYVLFTDGMRTDALRKLSERDLLLEALRGQLLVPFFQPQYSTRTGTLCGLEVLARVVSKEGIAHLPERFLAAAYDMGIISEIDRLIITAAFEQLVEWEKQGLNVPQVSFNVSSSFLETGGAELMKKWRAVVKSPLAMELLENSLLDEDKKEILASVSDLRAAGFSMEIDDFGSGRASILGLLRLRPDKIKLDKALIEPLGNSESQKMTIKSLIEIVRLQGCDVLAEGVETAAQLAVLKELGCDAVQGFFLSQPLTVDACTVELQRAQAAFQAQNWGVVRAV